MSVSAAQNTPADDLARVFSALGDTTRLSLIERLLRSEALSISQLCEGEAISRQAISKHLNALTQAKLVSAQRSGREKLYRLERERIEQANDFLSRVEENWDGALNRLKHHLEQE